MKAGLFAVVALSLVLLGQAQVSLRETGMAAGRPATFSASQQVPVPTGKIHSGDTGNISTSFSYQSVGTQASVGVLKAPDEVRLVETNIEWSGLVESTVSLSAGINAPVHLKTKVEGSYPLSFDRPVLFSSVLSLPKGPDAKAQAYVVIFRITVTAVKG